MKLASCSLSEIFFPGHGTRNTAYINSILWPKFHYTDYTPFQANKRVNCVRGKMVGISLLENVMQNLDLIIACCFLALATHGLILRRYPEVSENLDQSH